MGNKPVSGRTSASSVYQVFNCLLRSLSVVEGLAVGQNKIVMLSNFLIEKIASKHAYQILSGIIK